jgi:hypothetical protein
VKHGPQLLHYMEAYLLHILCIHVKHGPQPLHLRVVRYFLLNFLTPFQFHS